MKEIIIDCKQRKKIEKRFKKFIDLTKKEIKFTNQNPEGTMVILHFDNGVRY